MALPTIETKHHASQQTDYLEFPHNDGMRNGEAILNRHSSFITNEHDFPAARTMLFAAGVPDKESMEKSPQVGIATVWWEGNPCNMHLLELGREVKQSVQRKGYLAWQYNTIGVSDGITMGNEGMRFSLQSREIIADSVETVTCAQAHDSCIAIPGCDKNMPGCVMGIARHNRPSVVIYGGTSRSGHSRTMGRPIDMNTPSEARGAYVLGTLHSWASGAKYTAEEIMHDIETNSVPGPGACGGMYTANSLATVIETLGLSIPGSSSSPALSPEKFRECNRMGEIIEICLKKNIRPSDLLTKTAFENALTMIMALGCSTNSVLHTIAMARSAGIELDIDDFQRVSNKTPFIANMTPSGKYSMEDLFEVGGIPSVMKLLIAAGFMDGTTMTVTGKTMAENVEPWPSLPQGQEIIRSISNPIRSKGHIEILRGNIAPGGAVAKITGKQGSYFKGTARVFDKEHQLCAALDRGLLPRDEPLVLVVRYEGPKGGPGMPEQLRASGALMGGGYTNVALITDGRYSGASHGFIVGHIVPEAAAGGPIAVIEDGDVISIDTTTHRIDMLGITDDEIQKRLVSWTMPPRPVRKGTLAKYAHLVSNASQGAVTDMFF
ncbi:dihydroxy-acid/6-phosphogluconate dehydratase [Plectosphaerella plurivora]|uniref:dihydroxy-acid dehydratase n=1 Tax=Plectosphaerella plurivora TaxID=936078 RepID=A0A9P8UUX5_9PEZI|nr:dihydroxy-acid/6-phosphogluconate dehydratase [Plectosphaerella plurivora]